MITDLFISMTLLKILFNQKYFRLFSSFENVQSNLNNSSFYSSANKSSRVNVSMERVYLIYFIIYYFFLGNV